MFMVLTVVILLVHECAKVCQNIHFKHLVIAYQYYLNESVRKKESVIYNEIGISLIWIGPVLLSAAQGAKETTE